MSDDDPELVRRAIPFGLKLYETLLQSVPKHVPLLITTCGGYTGYAYAFLETDADLLSEEHHDEIVQLRDEAVKLYLRGKGFCARAMEIRFPGIMQPLEADPKAALKRVEDKADVPLLYWTAASWSAAMSLRKDPGSGHRLSGRTSAGRAGARARRVMGATAPFTSSCSRSTARARSTAARRRRPASISTVRCSCARAMRRPVRLAGRGHRETQGRPRRVREAAEPGDRRRPEPGSVDPAAQHHQPAPCEGAARSHRRVVSEMRKAAPQPARVRVGPHAHSMKEMSCPA